MSDGVRPEPASTGPGAGRSTGDRVGIGLTSGLAGALGLSWLFPVSTARLAEPSPGIRFDPIVHLGGSLFAVVLGLSTAAIAVRALDRRSVSVVPKRVDGYPVRPTRMCLRWSGFARPSAPSLTGGRSRRSGSVSERSCRWPE